MKTFSLTQLLILSLFITACAAGTSNRSMPATNNPSPASSATSPGPSPASADLLKRIEEIAAKSKGKVGVAAKIISSGPGGRDGQQLLVSLNAREHFPMQSVYKVPISMAVLKQVDAGKITLDQKVKVTASDMIGRAAHSPIRARHPNGAELSVRELLQFAVSESDGTASDVLMKLAGGAEAVTAYLRELSINDMMIINTEKEFSQDSSLQYRNWTTPEAAVAVLQALHERRGISEPSAALLVKLMVESKSGAQRLKGLLPAGTEVAHKTGTSGTENGITAATNDIGIITLPYGRHLAIAVFVSESPADQKTREGVIAEVAKAIWDEVNKEQ